MNTFLYCCFLSVIILVFAYINSQKVLEKFTPQLSQMYRPYVRHARLTYDELTDNIFKRMYNLYKKW